MLLYVFVPISYFVTHTIVILVFLFNIAILKILLLLKCINRFMS